MSDAEKLFRDFMEWHSQLCDASRRVIDASDLMLDRETIESRINVLRGVLNGESDITKPKAE